MSAEQRTKLPDLEEAKQRELQRHAFDYFLKETNPTNGLVADSSRSGSPASIACVMMLRADTPQSVALVSAASYYREESRA